MKGHADALPAEQQDVLRQLGPSAAELGFYLGGGTAIAIHLGHRQSVDLDWLTEQRIENPLGLAKEFQDRGIALRVGSVQRGTLHGDVHSVRVSFLEYRYPLLDPLPEWPDFGCRIASLGDLAAMKLLAVDQRGTKKDFVDIHALGISGLALPQMLELFRKKFGVQDVSRVLYSLTYFEDAEQEPMPTLLADIAWDRVKADIRAWVKSMAAQAE